jgi:predicted ATPase with chaperone activity
MKTVLHQRPLSAQVYHYGIKNNRMIADLSGTEAITHAYLAEAPQYWPKMELM